MRRRWFMATLALAVLAAAGVALTQNAAVPSPRGKTATVRAIGPELVVRVPWGTSPSTVSRLDGNEGASEGPMSFAVSNDGRTWFLDQVRQRLALFATDGSLAREVPIPASTFQDFEVTDQGWFVLLDRLASRVLLVLDPSGKSVREVPIEGPGIPEGGGVTAMLADDAGIWLEFNHSARVRVLDAALLPCERTIAPGRAVSPDVQAVAALDGSGGVVLSTQDIATGAILRQTSVALDHPIARIVWLQADASGDIHAAFHLLAFDPEDPKRVVYEQVHGARYDRSLQLRATWTSPQVIQVWEQFREMRVHSDGTIYQMGFANDGVSVMRWRWTS